MTVDSSRPVKQIVAAMPWSARIFEAFGIDFCCEGNLSLHEACRKAGLSPDQVIQKLGETQSSDQPSEWDTASLAALMKHIVEKHHTFCRQELTRLGALFAEALRPHAGECPEMAKLQKCFAKMSSELLMHLAKEEQTLFPMIEKMEQAAACQQTLPRLPFGTIQNPIGMMVFEHDETGVDLTQMRELSQGFKTPPEADRSLQALYEGLKAFEMDMHEHVFLENYVLFPRTAVLEKQVMKTSAAP